MNHTPRWLQNWRGWNALALTASLAHVLIDFHIGLFGPSSRTMSGIQAFGILCTALAYGAWAYVLAVAAGDGKTTLANVLAFAAIWSFLNNGLIAVFAAPPPSAAFPYQDLAHFGNVIGGGLAVYSTWWSLRIAPLPLKRRFPLLSIAGILLLYVGQNSVIAFR